MSDDDEDRTCRYGTALPELPADVIPTKKPITVADQIAVDANGKRRFHGAFTGGFSAGFWNTVGILEGWKPKEFKSSRTEKAQRMTQAPTDFMDDEDMGEFGIAPQRIQTTEDFTAKAPEKDNRKRPALRNDGPVLGTPVLQLFLKPAKDKASVSLLKKMGWREEQGIGSRLTKRDKKKAAERYLKERGDTKVYHCDMGPLQKPDQGIEEDDEEDVDDDESDSDDSDEEITFAPDDYEPFLHAFKTNRFGLGYEGLNKTSGSVAQQHINLFAPFEVLDRKNKKLSITGQAFGVGAFEEDDDDIYARDDMTNYDFKLGQKAKTASKKPLQAQSANIIDGFAVSKSHQKRMQKKIYNVDVPSSYTPRNWAVRKTRFGPVTAQPSSSSTDEGHRRHMLSAEERGQLLNDTPAKPKETTINTSIATTLDASSVPDVIIKTEPVDIPPKAPERKALNFIKLPDSLNFDRFVSEKDLVVVKEEPKVKIETKKVEVVRTKKAWLPSSLLYEKMNIAEPSGGSRKGNKEASATKSIETISTIPPAPSTSNVMKPKILEIPIAKNKSELELKSLSMETKHPSEKKDLFKAIFDSDDEEETPTEIASESISEPQPIISTRNEFLPKPATILNVLRNTSPPRGIFSNMFKITTEVAVKKPEFESTSTKLVDEKSNTDGDSIGASVSQINLLYGPSLPVATIPSTTDFITSTVKEKSLYTADEWVEKGQEDDDWRRDVKKKDKKKHKDKKVKKHKKEKSKKKKSNKEKSR